MGVSRPRRKILGQELAGEVEAVGADVRQFRPGDRVFGTTGLRFGAYAEFVCLPERSTTGALATIPPNVSDEEAAAVPTGGLEALHLLRRAGPLNGRRVQIVGAAGGIGTYAVQVAKQFGAVVTGVDYAGRLPLLRTLGADAVVEAAQVGGSSPANAFEVVFDVVGRGSFRARSSALTPDGVYLLANPNLAGWLRARWPSGAGRRRVVVGATRPSREDLEFLGRSLAEHRLRSPIDRRFPLAEVAAAHRYFESGQALGKVIITVDDGPRRVPAAS